MRPIVESGKLYKVYAPLYKIDNKENPFIIQKKDMVEIYQKELTKWYKITPLDKNKPLDKYEMEEFLEAVYDYRENLSRAAQSSGNIDKFFLETVIGILVELNVLRNVDDYDDITSLFSNQKFIRTFMSKLQKSFPESRCSEGGKIFAVTHGTTSMVKITKRLYKKTSYLIPVIKEYGYKVKVKEKNKEQERIMSIGELLDSSMKLYPTVMSRYKGLTKLALLKLLELLGSQMVISSQALKVQRLSNG